jgi:hypothetical protein
MRKECMRGVYEKSVEEECGRGVYEKSGGVEFYLRWF